jgi:serine/threonine protein phosphatase PrpC
MKLIIENTTVAPTINHDAPSKNEMEITYYAITGKGGRAYNEDHHGHARHGNTVTFAVSDGIGGQAGGAMASEAVIAMVRRNAMSLDRNEILQNYQAIEQEIRHKQQQHAEYRNMGATIAEIRIDPVRRMAIWAHLGDSRIYWIRNNKIMMVTSDHSVVKSLVIAGLISEQEALQHPKKNILLGAFGVAGDVEPEVLETPVDIVDGDSFLLCTDGLWNCIPDGDILFSCRTASTVEEWVKQLESQVLASALHDKDNYTAIGVRITRSANNNSTVRYDWL